MMRCQMKLNTPATMLRIPLNTVEKMLPSHDRIGARNERMPPNTVLNALPIQPRNPPAALRAPPNTDEMMLPNQDRIGPTTRCSTPNVVWKARPSGASTLVEITFHAHRNAATISAQNPTMSPTAIPMGPVSSTNRTCQLFLTQFHTDCMAPSTVSNAAVAISPMRWSTGHTVVWNQPTTAPTAVLMAFHTVMTTLRNPSKLFHA